MRYCITGGIGAGKSYVCHILQQHGIDIYDCDRGARRLIETSPQLIAQLTALVGPDTYNADGTLNRRAVTHYLLASEEHKQHINAIVHPAVMDDFHHSGLQWMESAILYEAHLEHYVDKVIAVTAPADIRIERIMHRDGITYEKARQWLDKQSNQEEVARRADYVVVNDGKADVSEQVENILTMLRADKA